MDITIITPCQALSHYYTVANTLPFTTFSEYRRWADGEGVTYLTYRPGADYVDVCLSAARDYIVCERQGFQTLELYRLLDDELQILGNFTYQGEAANPPPPLVVCHPLFQTSSHVFIYLFLLQSPG